MRRQLVNSTLLIVVATVFVLGVPLGVVATRLVQREAQLNLQRQAEAIGTAVQRDIQDKGDADPVTVNQLAGNRLEITVYDVTGKPVATGGQPIEGRSVSAEVDLPGVGSVQVRTDRGSSDRQVFFVWMLVAFLALLAFAVAAALISRQAKTLARPLEELKATSERLGAGDFSTRVATAGVPEIDAVAEALNRSAERLTELVSRERDFSANVSHQLRTPLTAMQIRIESALADGDPKIWKQALDASLDQVERLTGSVDELLSYARQRRGKRSKIVDVGALVKQQVQHWKPLFEHSNRALELGEPDRAIRAKASSGPLGQALDVLLDNALQHGAGTVRVEISRVADGPVLVAVTDDGAGVPAVKVDSLFDPNPKHEGRGIGLPLASTMLAADGGRLELTRARPPRFVIALPGPETAPREPVAGKRA